MCKWGDTIDLEVTILAHLSYTGKERKAIKGIDRCIAPIVDALNKGGVLTRFSCCGHGKGPGSVVLADGRQLFIGYLHDPVETFNAKTVARQQIARISDEARDMELERLFDMECRLRELVEGLDVKCKEDDT